MFKVGSSASIVNFELVNAGWDELKGVYRNKKFSVMESNYQEFIFIFAILSLLILINSAFFYAFQLIHKNLIRSQHKATPKKLNAIKEKIQT